MLVITWPRSTRIFLNIAFCVMAGSMFCIFVGMTTLGNEADSDFDEPSGRHYKSLKTILARIIFLCVTNSAFCSLRT